MKGSYLLLSIWVWNATFSLLSTIWQPFPDSQLNDKRNPLNVYFVKNGWAWTSLPILIVMISTSFAATLCDYINNNKKSDGDSVSSGSPLVADSNESQLLKRIKRVLIRWGFMTGYWFILTQWFFGPSLFERVLLLTGQCHVDVKGLTDIQTKRECYRNGGTWSGFDISGHCFLLVHCIMFIFEELRRFFHYDSQVRRMTKEHLDDDDSEEDREDDREPISNSPQILPHQLLFISEEQRLWLSFAGSVSAMLLLCLFVLWWIMMTITCIYFHSLHEKLLGTYFGSVGWAILYLVILPSLELSQ